MINSYATLQSAISDLLNRQDLTAQIPTFIQLCEAEISRDLLLQGALIQATATITSNVEALPSNCLQLVGIRLTAPGYGPLQRVEPRVLDNMAITPLTDIPKYYTTEGTRLRFFPTPPAPGVAVEITFYEAIPSLSAGTADNFLLLQYPDLYLYGSLKHTAPYLKDDDRVALWDALYQKAKEAAIIANERFEFGATPLTIIPNRPIGAGRTINGVLLR